MINILLTTKKLAIYTISKLIDKKQKTVYFIRCFYILFLDHVREFTCGKLYYRTFYLDERGDSLYVGAMWVNCFYLWSNILVAVVKLFFSTFNSS